MFTREYLNPLPGLNLVSQGHNPAIDLGTLAAMSDLGVHVVGKIQHGCTKREVDYLSLGC